MDPAGLKQRRVGDSQPLSRAPHRAARLDALWRANAARWGFWPPIVAVFAVVAYFGLNEEPTPTLWRFAAAFAALCAMLALQVRLTQPAIAFALILASAAAAGVGLAQHRTFAVAAPTLAAPIGPIALSGQLVRVERIGLGAARWTLDGVTIPGRPADATPQTVRLRIGRRQADDTVAPGDRVALQAMLRPPPGPGAPGAFDPARIAWFAGVGAVGWATTPPTVSSADAAAPVAAARERLARRIEAVIPGAAGGVAAAMTVGDRRAAPDWALEAVRAAGLGHLLAISGLHLGLAAGAVLFAIRGLFAFIPALALRWPTKKIAAVAALAAAFGYMLLAGGTPPTQRAFVFIAIAMIAMLADRRALGLRLAAIAVIAVLLLDPHAATGPSFQMSFAAAVALLAAYEVWRRRAVGRSSGLIAAIGRTLGATAASTLIAGAATAPFAAYHFQAIPLAGAASNLLAVPLTAFWIMPAATAGVVLSPFGLDSPFWTAMGWGAALLLEIATTAAAWPYAHLKTNAFAPGALAVMALGGLIVAVQRGWGRAAGLPLLGVGLTLAVAPAAPRLIAAPSGLVGLRAPGGDLLFTGAAQAGFERDLWARRWGASADAARAPPFEGALWSGALRCDVDGCLWRPQGADGPLITLPRTAAGAAADCRDPAVDAIVAPGFALGRCAATTRIDRPTLRRGGAAALTLDGRSLAVDQVGAAGAGRPWSAPFSR